MGVRDAKRRRTVQGSVLTSGSGLDLEDALLDGQDGDIKGAAAQVENENVALRRSLLLVQAVGNGGGCRLVDDAEHVQPGNDSSVLDRSEVKFINCVFVWIPTPIVG